MSAEQTSDDGSADQTENRADHAKNQELTANKRFPDEAVEQLAFMLGCPLHDEQAGPEPAIGADRQISVEGEVVYGDRDTSLIEDVAAWVLCHSLYNMRFANKKKSLGMYIQNLVLHIDDGAPVPRKALSKYRLFMMQA